MSELSCPCGQEAKIHAFEYAGKTLFNVVCSDDDCRCGRYNTIGNYATEEEAISAWNTLAEHPDTPEQVRYINDAYEAGWKACERETSKDFRKSACCKRCKHSRPDDSAYCERCIWNHPTFDYFEPKVVDE